MRRSRERVPSKGPSTKAGRAVRTDDDHGVLDLQRTVGNTTVGYLIEREAAEAGESEATVTATVQIGKLKFSATGGNLAAWAAGKVPDTLDATSQTGGHSAALKRLADDRTKIASLTITVAAPNKGGQLDMGSLVIEFTNGRIRGYDVDGATESWRLADFDGVHRTKTTHKVN